MKRKPQGSMEREGEPRPLASYSTGPSSGQSPVGFNFTKQVQLLCHDICDRVPELRHVDSHRVCFSFARTKRRGSHGLWASLTPMRFAGGAVTGTAGGTRYRCQRLYDSEGREMLYILTFYLPRFLNLDFRDKLTTIFHELWHISPAFDGDHRRYPGRCQAHSRSQKDYDAAVEELAARYLAASPPESLYGFLRHRFGDLQRRYGPVYGLRVPRPKLLPVN